MPRILSANRSKVLIDGEPVEGLQDISFVTERPTLDIAAIGEAERIGVVFGTTRVIGVIKARSTVPALEVKFAAGQPFQIVISTQVDGEDGPEENVISLQECYAHGKRFALGVGGVGETLYDFSATREGGG
ncbi:hypothetical protein [Rhodobaculum claviforme]|uniref:Uncharacterized protein n=1 Tax=Rhodobaculum claviforme TaxID=1549854 RepID=A0A934TGP4_9RHOB|nr:hypothetical protein [Rhodobaculum claviforme]MBK5926165.1 hypothetical protein [Rhodobaculum claviforme]